MCRIACYSLHQTFYAHVISLSVSKDLSLHKIFSPKLPHCLSTYFVNVISDEEHFQSEFCDLLSSILLHQSNNQCSCVVVITLIRIHDLYLVLGIRPKRIYPKTTRISAVTCHTLQQDM